MSRKMWKKLLATFMIIFGCCYILSTRKDVTDMAVAPSGETLVHQLSDTAELTKEYQRASWQPAYSTSTALWRANLTHPKQVLLLSYMRSGSSFVGDVFHHTPGVFYIYEPLDPLYSALYGTADGWTIPADIYFYPDGSPRNPPQQEINAVSWTLETIFNCNISSWPSAMLRHTFWQAWVYKMNDIGPYKKCLRSKNITGYAGSNKLCNKHIGAVCGGRFNAAKRQNSLCRDILWNEGKWFSTEFEIAQKLDAFAYNATRTLFKMFKKTKEELINMFVEYFKCHRLIEAPLKECARTSFDRVCREKPIRVVKTVRAGSDSAEALWEKFTNFKLVHLFRDPRGYARSKLKSKWAQGIFENMNAIKQAVAYCKRVVYNELTAFKLTRLPQRRHKRFKLIFDQLVSSPKEYVTKLFHFIEEPSVPDRTLQWLRKNTVGVVKDKERTNSTELAYKWMEVFTFKDVKTMNEGCREFFGLISYQWIL